MTEVIFGDSQSYLLPLDSLDVTYLSKYVRSSNDKLSPIWSQQRLNGESEYFHVKIAAQRIDGEDCYLESLDTYTCHICDINVPKICYNQHNESKQHETCKKICEKILERVAKQININNIDNDWHDTNNLYYCAPCSRAVNLKNKHKHESSDYHKKSEENMSIINDFYKKIIEDGTHINLPREHSYNESDSDSDESDIQDVQHDIVNNYFEQIPNIRNDLQKDIDSDEKLLNDIVLTVTGKNKDVFEKIQELETAFQFEAFELCNGSTSEQHQPFDSYLKEMISKHKLDVSTPVTDGEYIIIVSPNGDKVKVSQEDFHSYRHINKRVYCQVCKMWISQDTRPHEVTEKHVRNIFQSVDYKYARKMDTIYSHCLICNEVILTESDHQSISDDHKNLLAVAKIQENTESIDLKICNIFIDTHSLNAHNNPKEHNETEANADLLEINNIVKINCSEYVDTSNCKVNLDSNTLNNHINDNSTRIDKMSVPNIVTKAEYCETCKVEVPQGEMKAHNASESHKDAIIKVFWGGVKNGFTAFIEELKNEFQKYDNPRNKPLLINTVQNESLCTQNNIAQTNTTRNESFTAPNIKDINDIVKTESSISQNKTASTNTSQNECLSSEIIKINETKIETNKSLTSQHKVEATNTAFNKSLTSQIKTAGTNTAKNDNLSSKNNIASPNTAQNENFISHIKIEESNTSQKDNLSSQKEIEETNSTKNEASRCSVSNDTTDNKTDGNRDENKIKEYYKLVEYTDDTKSDVKCKMCNVQVPSDVKDVIQHMESINHKQIYREYTRLLNWRDTTKMAVVCQICGVNVNFNQLNIYEHMQGLSHELAMKKILDFHGIKYGDKKSLCTCCNVSVKDCYGHISSDEHTNSFLKEFAFDDVLMRKYVNKRFPKNVDAFLFRELYKNTLRTSKITELYDSRFYCGICNVFFSGATAIDHMLANQTSHHLSLYKE